FRFCGITTVAGKYQNDVQFLPEIYNSCVPILPAKNIYTLPLIKAADAAANCSNLLRIEAR
ncbi:MAG: hypothetical protein LBK56_14500, partial [Gracilibacteraceae bacterium]|nr:hypothetical protein [Gracilibacteraceae bacterium]